MLFTLFKIALLMSLFQIEITFRKNTYYIIFNNYCQKLPFKKKERGREEREKKRNDSFLQC